MSILANGNIYILETKNTHYVVGIDRHGYAHRLHWGAKCPITDYDFPRGVNENATIPELDSCRLEYTPFGKTMYRECAIKASFADGCREINPEAVGAKATDDTLSLTFRDEYYPLSYTLQYRVYEGFDIITRTVTVTNHGTDDIHFEKLMSAEIALPGTKPFHIMNTNGAWGAEGTPTNTLLDGGELVFESRRGHSGHNMSPYFIAYRNADERSGEVFYAHLAWSGSFRIEVSRDLFGVTRAELGMNSFDFEHVLEGGESFTAPAVILGRGIGFGDMSRQLNRFGVQHVLPKNFADKPLPVLYNSWEATEFDVNVTDQTALAVKAAAAGCELFVMDDGWFGARNTDHAGLGDWFVNKEKFPNGLGELIQNVNELGMDFGLWVEPEMVNPDSDLFRAHPDWAYHYPTRKANEIRWQLVLNMTKPEVQAYIFDCLDTLLRENNIKYIKWDMNRPFSETGGENLAHPKMLWYYHTKAVYDIVDRLKAAHPEVQFESCSSGGGRCDWGALYHYDQVWTSDNTDAIDRIVIQKAYGLTHPIKTMRAWVTDINWYNRNTPLAFRFNIAMRGALSLGGNLKHYSDEDIALCRHYTDLYKSVRNTVQFGDLYRLLDIDEDEIAADLYVSSGKTEAVLFIASVNTRCMKKPQPLYFDGLEDDRIYTFDIEDQHVEKSGAYLKNVGLPLDIKKQYYNQVIVIKAK
ncbi:MAG: alpha-galactosidase [Eubacterium sp.]|nr:alpha-galactosidase [Eubacterium sp.]